MLLNDALHMIGLCRANKAIDMCSSQHSCYEDAGGPASDFAAATAACICGMLRVATQSATAGSASRWEASAPGRDRMYCSEYESCMQPTG
jgi:hypothetical protein